ncbi:MAG: prenyltransferase/squalene oxidase repeat-containing protein, partial [Solirubrobacteraceae bacterium]|nr:terpene cyclase/mutase family protein [Patulibacter sp.]
MSVRRTAAIGLAVTAAAAWFVAVPASTAAPPTAADAARLGLADRWLEQQQTADGSLAVPASSATRPIDANAWGALGLAVGGDNAQDLRIPSGATLASNLQRQAPGVSDTVGLAELTLVAVAIGSDPHAFGGVDLPRAILASGRVSGAFGVSAQATDDDVTATVFAALALSTIREPATVDGTQRAADWLLAHQAPDGSWPGSDAADPTQPPGTTEVTAEAIEALNAAGRRNTAAQSKALAWLQLRQNADGGFAPSTVGQPSDARATASVALALVSAGIDPVDLVAPTGASPMTFLSDAQDGPRGGAVAQRPGVPGTDQIRTTAYAALAFARTPLPFGPIARGAGTGTVVTQPPPTTVPTSPVRPPTQTPAPVGSPQPTAAPDPAAPPAAVSPAAAPQLQP